MTRSIYTNPTFLRFLLGYSASGLASWGLIFILGISVIEGQLTATELGIALALRTFGFLFGVTAGGIFADRHSRRIVILICGLIALIGIIFILVGFSTSIFLTYLGCLVTGVGQGACRPAFQAYIPTVVDEAHLQPANASLGLSVRLAVLLGPAMVNLMVVAFSVLSAYYLLIGLWLLCSFVTPWVDEQTKVAVNVASNIKDDIKNRTLNDIEADEEAPIQTDRLKNSLQNSFIKNTVNDWLEGLTEAKKHPWFLYSLSALTLVIAFGYSVTNILLPLVAKQSDNLNLMTSAITAYTFGGIVSGVVLNKVEPRPRGWFALFGMALYGIAPLSLLFINHEASIQSMWDTWLPVICYFICGVGIQLNSVIWFSSVQREVAPSHLARVSSIDFLCAYGLAPLGLMIIAPLAEVFGLKSMLIFCAVVCFIAPMLATIEKSSKHYSVKV